MNYPSKTLTITQAKRKLLELVENIENTGDCIAITKNGIPSTVLINADDYEAMIETMEILASPHIMKSLKKSKAQAKKKQLLDDVDVWE